jgi:hypothetical protein
MFSKMIFLFIFLSTVTVLADENGICINYDAQIHEKFDSEIVLTGKLRFNKMLENVNSNYPEFDNISLVLVSENPLFIQQGEINNPIACSVSDFTLYLSPEQLEDAKTWMAQGKTVEATGHVRMAETSIEEYDNGTLVHISKLVAK